MIQEENLVEPPLPEELVPESEFWRGSDEEWSLTTPEEEIKSEVLDRYRNRTSSDKDNGILEDTLYKQGDAIYKTTRSRSSGWLYAKLLNQETGEWQYAAGVIKEITAENRMTIEEAQQYGRTTGRCCVCGAKLTNEASIAYGIGPICAQRW